MTTLTGARVVTSGGILDRGVIDVHGEKILSVSSDSASTAILGEKLDLGGGYVVPGFIDIHCHGAAGADFGTADVPGVRDALGYHLRHGTTGLLASLVAAPVEHLVLQLEAIAAARTELGAALLGVHAEGPYLSAHRCGAQNPQYLIDPDPVDIQRLIVAGDGMLSMMTIAPELAGALEAIKHLVSAGIVAAVGHTDATYRQAAEGFEAGATVATHLFNGMRPVHHREPGPVLAALDASAACEVINDGFHVHESVLRLVADRNPAQLVLISDAISATGVGDGHYELGAQDLTVSDGAARITATGSLAGSTLTLDRAVQRAVQVGGIALETAVGAASTNPARVLGLSHERGDIRAGLRADLVHLDDDLNVVRVMHGGKWI